MEAEEFPDMLCEVECNGVLISVGRSEYYRRQAAGQFQGPDAPFPWEKEIAELICARSTAFAVD